MQYDDYIQNLEDLKFARDPIKIEKLKLKAMFGLALGVNRIADSIYDLSGAPIMGNDKDSFNSIANAVCEVAQAISEIE